LQKKERALLYMQSHAKKPRDELLRFHFSACVIGDADSRFVKRSKRNLETTKNVQSISGNLYVGELTCCVVAALGCADFTTPTGTVVDRQSDAAVIRCTRVMDHGQQGQLTIHCVNGTWTPTPPTSGCSVTTAASAPVKSFDIGAFALSEQGHL